MDATLWPLLPLDKPGRVFGNCGDSLGRMKFCRQSGLLQGIDRHACRAGQGLFTMGREETAEEVNARVRRHN